MSDSSGKKAGLSKTSRIGRRREIQHILLSGTKWECPFFKIVWLSNVAGRPRLAVLVSKRNGNSVTRNCIKRRIREIFRNNRSGLPNLDLIVSANAKGSHNFHQQCDYFLSWKQSITA